MNRTLKNLSLITLLWCVAFSGQAKQLLDRVAVIVDQGVVLESEIVELVSSVKAGAVTSGQTLPSDRALRTQAIERLILENYNRKWLTVWEFR
jgi:peptidyl-prolyl cis-trans isomerase SurA